MKKEIVANGIHNYTPPEEYVPPKSSQVQKHLEWFMGLKLDFMMHWAPGERSLREMGAWLRLFGKGIYNTRICAPSFEDRLFYTQTGEHAYAFYAYDEVPALPDKLTLRLPRPVSSAQCMRTGQNLRFRQGNGRVTLDLGCLPMGGAFYAEGFEFAFADEEA